MQVGDRVRYVGQQRWLHGCVGTIARPRTDKPPGSAWGIFFEMENGIEYCFASAHSLVLVGPEPGALVLRDDGPDVCAGVTTDIAV